MGSQPITINLKNRRDVSPVDEKVIAFVNGVWFTPQSSIPFGHLQFISTLIVVGSEPRHDHGPFRGRREIGKTTA
jgi:hypothetical protein